MPAISQELLRRYAKPTRAQAEAGNYRMGHIRIHGLDISIETPKGKRRRPEWPAMAAHYGYFKRSTGNDGDHVDVFLGPNQNSQLVVVVDQVNRDGSFDEHKVLLGFVNATDAIDTYKKCYTKGWRVGKVTIMTIPQFKSWLKDGSQAKPISDQVSKYSTSETVVGKHGDEGRYVTTDDGNQIFITKSGEINRTGKPVEHGEPQPKRNRPDYDQRLKALQERRGESGVPDFAEPVSQNPLWKESKPSHPAAVNPASESHPLHHSNLPPEMQQTVLRLNMAFNQALGNVGLRGSAARIHGNDPAVAKREAFDNLDKKPIEAALGQLKDAINQAAQQGINLRPVIRHNNIIPRDLAVNLKPNSRLFRPVKQHERFSAMFDAIMDQYAARKLKSMPGQMGLFDDHFTGKFIRKPNQQQTSFDWDESKVKRDNIGRFATQPGNSRPKGSPERKLLGKRAGDSKVIGAMLYDQIANKKPASLLGHTVSSAEDLASLAQVYRDPRFETLRAFFVKDGKIIGQNAYSSRLPGMVVFSKNMPNEIKADLEELGADGFYLLHNHPTGDPRPSREDIQATESIDSFMPGKLIAHVIIDHTAGTIIGPKGNTREYSIDNEALQDTSKATVPHEFLDYQLTSTEAFGKLALQNRPEDGRAMVVLTNAKYKVRAILDVNMESLKTESHKMLGAIRRATRLAGAGGMRFLVLPEGVDSRGFKKLAEGGMFGDIVSVGDETLRTKTVVKVSEDPIAMRATTNALSKRAVMRERMSVYRDALVDKYMATLDQYAAKKGPKNSPGQLGLLNDGKPLRSSKVQQKMRWITVHPNGAGTKGVPVMIDNEGTVQGGMGGKFTGQKIGDLGKNPTPKTKGTEHQPAAAGSPANEENAEARGQLAAAGAIKVERIGHITNAEQVKQQAKNHWAGTLSDRDRRRFDGPDDYADAVSKQWENRQDSGNSQAREQTSAVTWDTIPGAGKRGFEKNVLDPLRKQVEELDKIANNPQLQKITGDAARYAWEVAIKGGKGVGDSHAGTSGLERWAKAAKQAGIENADDLAASHSEYQDLVKRLDAYRGWGDQSSDEQEKPKPASAEQSNPFRDQAEAIRRRAESLSPGGSARDKAMAAAFPLGTGNPGNASSRRTSKQAAKRMDASIDNAKRALQLFDAAKQMEASAEQFDKGLIDKHGNPTDKGIEASAKVAQQRVERAELKKTADEHLADYMRETLKPGDQVFLAGSSNSVTVKWVNAKSISTDMGSKWRYDELRPANAEGKAMSTKEMADLVKSRMGASKPQVQEPSGIEVPVLKNEEAKSGDQLGLFGERKVAPRKQVDFTGGKGKAKQANLIDGLGAAEGQMSLIDEAGAPEDMVYKPKKKDLFAAIKQAYIERYMATLDRNTERYRAGADSKAPKAQSNKSKVTTGSFGDRGRFVTLESGQVIFIKTDGSVGRGPRELKGQRVDASKGKERKRDPKTARGDKFAPKSKLDLAIVDAVGDHPDDVEAFKGFVGDAHKMIATERREQLDDMRQLLGHFGLNGKAAAGWLSSLKRMRDYSKIPAFDEMVDHARKYMPAILTGEVSESEKGGDDESRLFARLQSGFPAPPAKHDADVIALAQEMAGTQFLDDHDDYKPKVVGKAVLQNPDDPFSDYVPFSASFGAQVLDRYHALIA